MKNAKRMLSILLACVLAFSCMTVGAWAEDKGNEHKFTVLLEAHEASCVAGGLLVYGCAVEGCEVKKYVPTDKLEHKFTVKLSDECIEPTCVTGGKNVFKCANCDETKTDTLTATGHSFTVKLEEQCVASTCVTAGQNVFKCANCEETKTDTLPLVGHTYVTTKTKPTCTQDGNITTTCSVPGCDYKEVHTLKAIGHKLKDAGDVHACVNEGCAMQVEHSYNEEKGWSFNGDNGFFTNGTEKRYCKDGCGHIETREAANTSTLYKLAHGTFGFMIFLVNTPVLVLAKLLDDAKDFFGKLS